jgi:hypothetical protein
VSPCLSDAIADVTKDLEAAKARITELEAEAKESGEEQEVAD